MENQTTSAVIDFYNFNTLYYPQDFTLCIEIFTNS